MSEDIARQLGEITAQLKGIEQNQMYHREKLDGIDERLRSVERKGAINGAVAGGVIAIAVAFIKDSFKA